MMQVINGKKIYQALSALARRYQFRNRDEVCCYGLTVSQCYALQTLYDAGEMSSSALSARLGLDLSSTTRLIDQLLKKKLTVRVKSDEDARVRKIRLTEAGSRLISRIETDFANMLAQALSGFDPKVLHQLPDVLQTLTAALNCAPAQTQFIPAGNIRKL